MSAMPVGVAVGPVGVVVAGGMVVGQDGLEATGDKQEPGALRLRPDAGMM